MISIEVKGDVILPNNVTKWEHVQTKENWAQDGPLRDPKSDRSRGCEETTQSH